jgi:TPR repeat protein
MSCPIVKLLVMDKKGLWDGTTRLSQKIRSEDAIRMQEESPDWLSQSQLATVLGPPDAQYNLGLCYWHGKGAEKDHVKAVECFKRAASQEHCDAQFVLALAYKTGDGVSQSDEEAFKYFRLAAEFHVKAQYQLGNCFLKGSGVNVNFEKAVDWFKAAAMNRHKRAQLKLDVLVHSQKASTADNDLLAQVNKVFVLKPLLLYCICI